MDRQIDDPSHGQRYRLPWRTAIAHSSWLRLLPHPKATMSTFSKATDNIVHEIDDGDGGSLVHASRIHESHKLELMRLLQKQNPKFFWQKPKYWPTDFKLGDLVQGEPLCPVFLPLIELPTYQGSLTLTFDGSLCANDAAGIAKVNLGAGGCTKTQAAVGKLMKELVDMGKLEADINGRKVNMQHSLVRQVKKYGRVLAVLTERVFTDSACTISKNRKRKGLVDVAVKAAAACIKNTASVELDSDVSLKLPSGTVIAYRPVDLNIQRDGYFELCLVDDDGDIQSDSMMLDGGLIPELENLSPLAELPQSTRSALFQSFCEVMKDRDALSDLENTLACDSPVETEHAGVNFILEKLRDIQDSHGSGSPLNAGHIFVSAMEELDDDVLRFLSECSPDVLTAFNDLLKGLDLQDQEKTYSPPHLDSLPHQLQQDKAFHSLHQLLVTSSVNQLVLCFTVRGLSALCDH